MNYRSPASVSRMARTMAASFFSASSAWWMEMMRSFESSQPAMMVMAAMP
jgi:hypothetical protein